MYMESYNVYYCRASLLCHYLDKMYPWVVIDLLFLFLHNTLLYECTSMYWFNLRLTNIYVFSPFLVFTSRGTMSILGEIFRHTFLPRVEWSVICGRFPYTRPDDFPKGCTNVHPPPAMWVSSSCSLSLLTLVGVNLSHCSHLGGWIDFSWWF